jgi:hypothetical protein
MNGRLAAPLFLVGVYHQVVLVPIDVTQKNYAKTQHQIMKAAIPTVCSMRSGIRSGPCYVSMTARKTTKCSDQVSRNCA